MEFTFTQYVFLRKLHIREQFPAFTMLYLVWCGEFSTSYDSLCHVTTESSSSGEVVGRVRFIVV